MSRASRVILLPALTTAVCAIVGSVVATETASAHAAWPAALHYVSPLPDSRLVSPATGIIARFEPRGAFQLRVKVTRLVLSLKAARDLDAEPAQHPLRVVARRLRLAHARAPTCAEPRDQRQSQAQQNSCYMRLHPVKQNSHLNVPAAVRGCREFLPGVPFLPSVPFRLQIRYTLELSQVRFVHVLAQSEWSKAGCQCIRRFNPIGSRAFVCARHPYAVERRKSRGIEIARECAMILGASSDKVYGIPLAQAGKHLISRHFQELKQWLALSTDVRLYPVPKNNQKEGM